MKELITGRAGYTGRTRDGTDRRDNIHVCDLARAHVCAVEQFDAVLATEQEPSTVINLGTGAGVTVLLAAFERVYGDAVPTRELPPGPGDAWGRTPMSTRLRGFSVGGPSHPSTKRSQARWSGANAGAGCCPTSPRPICEPVGGQPPSSDSKLASSRRCLTVVRNRAASAPSTSRWSYVSAR